MIHRRRHPMTVAAAAAMPMVAVDMPVFNVLPVNWSFLLPTVGVQTLSTTLAVTKFIMLINTTLWSLELVKIKCSQTHVHCVCIAAHHQKTASRASLTATDVSSNSLSLPANSKQPG